MTTNTKPTETDEPTQSVPFAVVECNACSGSGFDWLGSSERKERCPSCAGHGIHLARP